MAKPQKNGYAILELGKMAKRHGKWLRNFETIKMAKATNDENWPQN